MTYEEAAREWNKYIRCQENGKSKECYFEYGFDCDKCGNEMEICIDLVRTSIEALDKQIPKKGRAGWANYCECPSCEWIIETEEPFNFCFNCGQRIDFSEV